MKTIAVVPSTVVRVPRVKVSPPVPTGPIFVGTLEDYRRGK